MRPIICGRQGESNQYTDTQQEWGWLSAGDKGRAISTLIPSRNEADYLRETRGEQSVHWYSAGMRPIICGRQGESNQHTDTQQEWGRLSAGDKGRAISTLILSRNEADYLWETRGEQSAHWYPAGMRPIICGRQGESNKYTNTQQEWGRISAGDKGRAISTLIPNQMRLIICGRQGESNQYTDTI